MKNAKKSQKKKIRKKIKRKIKMKKMMMIKNNKKLNRLYKRLMFYLNGSLKKLMNWKQKINKLILKLQNIKFEDSYFHTIEN